MIDIDLLVQVLRKRGHSVDSVIPVPDNAGDYELIVDGNLIPLIEARHLLELDDAARTRRSRPPTTVH
jgi:hypothetical protein